MAPAFMLFPIGLRGPSLPNRAGQSLPTLSAALWTTFARRLVPDPALETQSVSSLLPTPRTLRALSLRFRPSSTWTLHRLAEARLLPPTLRTLWALSLRLLARVLIALTLRLTEFLRTAPSLLEFMRSRQALIALPCSCKRQG